MCDGCPDMTIFNGQMSWSCRLEECRKFGQFIQTVPKEANPGGRANVLGSFGTINERIAAHRLDSRARANRDGQPARLFEFGQQPD